MFGQGFNYGFLGKPLCFTDTTDIFKDNSGVALYTLDYDASDSGGATGKFNEGAVLTGTSSQINFSSIPLSAFNATTVSVSLWVNMQALTSGYSSGSYIFRGRGNWIIQVTTNGVIFAKFNTSQGNNGNNDLTYNFSGGTSLNQWYHIVVTDNGTATSGLKLYVDGVLRDSNSGYANIDDNSWIAGIANYAGRAGGNFKVDQLRIFNKVISASEVATLYSESKNTTNSLQILGDTSCIATYPFDGSSTDLSGNYSGTDTNIIYKYDGTPTAVDFGVGGKTLYGARFNGSSSVIDSNYTLPADSTMSFSMWLKQDTHITGLNGIFSDYDSSGADINSRLTIALYTNNSLYLNIGNGASSWGDNSISMSNYIGTWMHLCITINGTAVKVYINGGTPTNLTSSVAFGTTGARNQIIGRAGELTGSGRYYKGDIDQVRIFNKALSSAEVSKLYGNGAGEIACEYTATTTDINYPVTNTAYYKLDNNSKDSGETTGKFNQGATFIGNSAGIVNTTLQLSSTAHSVSLWMKPQDLTATKWQIMFFSAFNGYPSFTLGKRPDRTTSFHYRNESSNEVYFTLSNADTWYHVVVTRNNSGSTVYVNGSSVATDSNSMGTYSSSSYEKASIGSNPNYPAEYFDGTLDQVRVYDVALTATDVANLYNNETTATTGTLSFPTGKTAIATYKLDGDGVDISGNYSGSEGANITYAYDGTEANIEYRFGRYGQAAVFNGSSSRINLPVGLGTTGARSNSLWIKVDTFPSSGIDAFFYLGTQSANENYETISVTSTSKVKFQQRVGSATDMTAIESSETIIAGNWYHIATTHDGTTAKLYINGDLSKGGSVSFSSYVNNSSLTGNLGAFRTLTPSFDGSIDQYRRFHTALSAANVTSLYNEKPEADTSNFKAVLYEGTGANQYISNVGMDLETNGGLVWIKSRDTAYNHRLFDSVRTLNGRIESNTTAAEVSNTVNDNFVSFDANGFTLGSTSSTNGSNFNGDSFVSWVWKGGGDAVQNTQGTITSDVSANTAAGFSIVKYSGNTGADQTVGHGLSSTPEMVIVKRLTDAGYSWCVQHIGLTSMGYNIYLDDNREELLRNRIIAWDSTTFTVEQVHEVNNTGKDYIAYCWHSVAGYSKIGSYTGGGATNVPVSLGFQPGFVIIKRATGGNGNWMMYDNVRQAGTIPYDNYTILLADDTYQEQSDNTIRGIQFTSDGFILNKDYVLTNNSGSTYIYMAFK